MAATLAFPLTLVSSQATVSDQMEAWYAAARRSAPGTWGVVVATQSGEVLWSINGTQPLVPASTVKLLTTGFARTIVGADARKATRVVGSGGVDPTDGTWKGTWALELNGDPTLERPDVAGPTLQALANQLRDIGVRRLVGPLDLTTEEGEPTAVYPGAWSPRHRGKYYAPPVGPVAINENVIAFAISPGTAVGRTPVISADMPQGVGRLVRIEATTVAGTRNRLRLRVDGNGWVVSGSIGSRAAARRYSFVAHDPASVVEATWDAALERAGIDWNRVASIGSRDNRYGRILAEVVSPVFDSVAHEINTRSVNIGAELMLRWGGGPDRAASRLEQHVREVTGLHDGIRLVDGSGLSDNDRVAPLVFTTYLANFPRTAAGRDFPLLLPMNGKGTLRSLATGFSEAGVVRAKTGTLGNASTLVGYLGKQDGMLLIAAMYNGRNTGSARQAQWELFRTLGADGVAIPSSAELDGDFTLGGAPVLTGR
jgi:D-alanyl-D-alanine carboxypeptidase/D-alanyl-D-alanine-endopeptidase (penicillin-binding protein 4)